MPYTFVLHTLYRSCPIISWLFVATQCTSNSHTERAPKSVSTKKRKLEALDSFAEVDVPWIVRRAVSECKSVPKLLYFTEDYHRGNKHTNLHISNRLLISMTETEDDEAEHQLTKSEVQEAMNTWLNLLEPKEAEAVVLWRKLTDVHLFGRRKDPHSWEEQREFILLLRPQCTPFANKIPSWEWETGWTKAVSRAAQRKEDARLRSESDLQSQVSTLQSQLLTMSSFRGSQTATGFRTTDPEPAKRSTTQGNKPGTGPKPGPGASKATSEKKELFCIVCGTKGDHSFRTCKVPVQANGNPLKLISSGNGNWKWIGGEKTMVPLAAPPSEWPVYRSLHLDRWHLWLNKYGLAEKHQLLLQCIEHGFSYYSSISISKNFIYPHLKSALAHPEVIDAMITKEREAGRYLGPFTLDEVESILGRPFIAHPLGVVPKSNGRHRVIEDLSWPHDDSFPSLNSKTDTSSLSLNWGSLADAAHLVVTAPPGSQAATVDWQDAFRNCGIRPSEWWLGVVHWKNLFNIDRALKFGGKASTHVFELPAAALCALLMAIWATLCVIYWVDDDHIRRIPINSAPPWQYDVDIEHICKLAADLGVVFPPHKIFPFSFEIKYIGFLWLYQTKEVRIPEQKRIDFLALLTSASESPSITLPALRTIVGKLSHFSLVVPLGRSNMRGLWSLQTAMSEKAHPNAAWPWTTRQREDLNWWRQTLTQPNVGMFLCTQTTPSSEFSLYCDASTSWGIGIVINNYWDAFKLQDGWNTSNDVRRDIGWAEFAAVEIVVFFVLRFFDLQNTHIRIHTDNQGVLGAWVNRSSRNPASNDVLGRVLSSLLARQCWLTLTYIKSADNPADRPSRGLPAMNASRHTFPGFPSELAGLMYRATLS